PVPQPFQTLGTHVPPSPSKAVAQKVKALASLAAIDNPGFLRMESQPMLCHPRLDQGQGDLGVGLPAAQEDEIVTVADDHIASVGHPALSKALCLHRSQTWPSPIMKASARRWICSTPIFAD